MAPCSLSLQLISLLDARHDPCTRIRIRMGCLCSFLWIAEGTSGCVPKPTASTTAWGKSSDSSARSRQIAFNDCASKGWNDQTVQQNMEKQEKLEEIRHDFSLKHRDFPAIQVSARREGHFAEFPCCKMVRQKRCTPHFQAAIIHENVACHSGSNDCEDSSHWWRAWGLEYKYIQTYTIVQNPSRERQLFWILTCTFLPFCLYNKAPPNQVAVKQEQVTRSFKSFHRTNVAPLALVLSILKGMWMQKSAP